MGDALMAARYCLANKDRHDMAALAALALLVAEIDSAPVALIDDGELCWQWRHVKEVQELEGERVALLRVEGDSTQEGGS
jgi:hypothetical protein